jgi:hypothetical protein
MQRKVIAETPRDFHDSIMLSDYLELTQSSYVKDMLSCVVPNNDNSAWITSSLSINTPASDQSLRQPIFLSKFNFRKLLSIKQTKPAGVYELALRAYVDGQKNIRLSAILRLDGEMIAKPNIPPANNGQPLLQFDAENISGLNEHLEIGQQLIQLLLRQDPPLSGKTLWQNIHDLQPMRLPSLKIFPSETHKKLELFRSSHTLIQTALIKRFKNYLAQLKTTYPKMPLASRAALALDACQNEMLNNAARLRIIEDLTYLADCVFNQDISGRKLILPQNSGQPLAIISEYFTLEDILQTYRHLPEDPRRPPVFISAWEPDFVPQELKLTSKTIRNNDAQELCSLLNLGFYISDETVENFQRAAERSPELVLSILDRDTLHNGDKRYAGGIIVVNTAAEVEKFIAAFKNLFKPNQEHLFDRRQFHKHEQTLGKIYGKFVRRMLTHHNQLALMLKTSPEKYAEYIRGALRECLPETAELLTNTDRENLKAAVDALTAKAAAEQKEFQEFVALLVLALWLALIAVPK